MADIFLAEHGPRHTRVAHTGVHDHALLTAQPILALARHVHDLIKVLGHQLEAAKRLAQLCELRLHFLVVAPAFLLDEFLGLVVLALECDKSSFCFYRIRAGVFFFFFLVLGLVLGILRVGNHLSRLRHVVLRIEISDQQI